MKCLLNLAFLFFLVGSFVACSEANIKRLSTFSYMGNASASRPYLTEAHAGRALGNMGDQGILWIHNPLPYGIVIHVECSSIFQADMDVHVAARSTRSVQATFPRSRISESCRIRSYEEDSQ